MTIKTLEYIHRLLIEEEAKTNEVYKAARKLQHEYEESEKSYIFHLVEFKSRYSGAHIEMLFKNSKRVVIRKDKGGHGICIWSDSDFTLYPYQAGIPYWFKRIEEAT